MSEEMRVVDGKYVQLCEQLGDLRAVGLHMKQRACITSIITYSLWCDNNAMSLCFKPAFRKA